MNLKEIGILLVGLYLVSSLIIAYKYYIARGKVYRISRTLILKYILRFILLLSFSTLAFYTINVKQINQVQMSDNNTMMFIISENSSSLTWNKLYDKVRELPEESRISLNMFMPKNQQWIQVIPLTNKDSFLHLIQNGHELTLIYPKLTLSDNLNSLPKEDNFNFYSLRNGSWELVNQEAKNSSFLSTDMLNSNIGSSYVRSYLVILILFLLFIDIVFTAKAIKI
jgi:predicted amino acid-binding ACT domain protein